MFNPAKVSSIIKEDFIDYITTTFPFADSEYQRLFKHELTEGLMDKNGIANGPIVDIKDIFEADPNETIDKLIKCKKLSPLFREIEKNKDFADLRYKEKLSLTRPLYKHQVESIKLICEEKKNVIITTGTGSGKTECFLIPILNQLLLEKEAGTLRPGVRAMLIYPMNALANDQMKRLREILMKYDDISFGVFNGDTKKTEKEASVAYMELHANENCPELQIPLKNEYISRETMMSTPPHILCTNYAMLEHMLLRPENDKIFSNSDFQFIVLDEAHTYSGATGMETALLLRRLKARIAAKGKTQYILTSATLGEKGKNENDIIKFAENLTGEKFENTSIVFGKRIKEDISQLDGVDININVFSQLAKVEIDNDNVCSIFEKNGIKYIANIKKEENLYNLCHNSLLYKKLRSISTIEKPLSIVDYATALSISSDEVIEFIYICTLCEKDGKALIDARYHYFIRALEGIYSPLIGEKKLFLERKGHIDYNGKTIKIFELAICKTCGEIAIVGVVRKSGHLEIVELAKQFEKKEDIRFFHILHDKREEVEECEDPGLEEIEDDQEESASKKKQLEFKDYYICPICGAISEYDDGMPKCACCKEDAIIVREYKNSEGKCAKCQSGRYNRFYLGNEAATAVLATSLFEELPTKHIKEYDGGVVYEREGGKQFLAFSDSRSEAAFFASYLDKSYKEFLRRRGFIYAINKNRSQIAARAWSIDELVDELKKLFKEKNAFRKILCADSDVNVRELEKNSLKNAWISVLTELTNSRRRTSLSSLGYIKFEYAGNTKNAIDGMSNKYNIDKEVCKNLLNELAMSFAYFGAIDSGDSDELDIDDKKYIYYTSKQKAVTLLKDSESHPEIMSWIARNREGKSPDSFYKNARQVLVMNTLHMDGISANEFLATYFNNVIIKKDNIYKATKGNGDFYYMPAKNFVIRVQGDQNANWYKCDTCNRITTSNIAGKCNTYHCNGQLEKIDPSIYFKDNHYLLSYNKEFFMPLIIKEHTAQLSREEALEYQQNFEKNKIHALSCSTTFEMGVDVGDLETVFLRNVPPTSANYSQRAGRAGRSKNSAAYALTYAKLSSHDFNYFKNPTEMINGKMRPPFFKIDNEKIVKRHIFAVVLSYFFSINSNYFNNNKAELLLNSDGFMQIKKTIENRDSKLTMLLRNSFGDALDREFGISEYKWIDEFVGENGILTKLFEEYNNTVKEFEDIIKQQVANKEYSKVGYTDYRMQLYKDKKVIDFLTRGNILPKYGFPIDTVELYIANQENKKKELKLSRDLKLAISEYAPGEKVIANDKMYTSRYIKKSIFSGNLAFHESYVNQCNRCHTWNYALIKPENEFKCINCEDVLPNINWIPAIEPRDGFITDGARPAVVPMRRPDKIYVNEDSYIGDQKEIKKYRYTVNGKNLLLCSTENDEIMVTSKTKFYVCKFCGFTYGVLDKIKDEKGKKDTKAIQGIGKGTEWIETKKPHKTANGRDCPSTLMHKEVLNHIFKTDVVTLEFENSVWDYESVLSSMYAILNAMSTELKIERTDINGCIKYVANSIGVSYSIVLYDAVAGGAGHVRNLLNNNGENLRDVINAAYKSMNCICDTSCYMCLRSYQNQKYHEKLNWRKANALLGEYAGEIKFVEEIIPNSETSIIVDKNSGVPMKTLPNKELWDYFISDLDDGADKDCGIKIFDILRGISYSKPDEYSCIIHINSNNFNVDLVWFEKKIMLFSNNNREAYEMAKKCNEWETYMINDMDIDKFVRHIEEI